MMRIFITLQRVHHNGHPTHLSLRSFLHSPCYSLHSKHCLIPIFSFLPFSPSKYNLVNVVFLLSISLIAFAPLSRILLSVNHSLFFTFPPSVSLFNYLPDSVLSAWCCFSVFHSMLLSHHLQPHYLLFIDSHSQFLLTPFLFTAKVQCF